MRQEPSVGTGAQEATASDAVASETAPAKADFGFWTEGSTSLQALVDYVKAATTEGSETYIPPEERIAVFDLDGTLMCETYPWCFEYMVFADYALNNPGYEAPDDIKAVAQEIVDARDGKKPENMSTRQAAAGAIAYKGLTPAQLEEYVNKFKGSKATGFEGMTRGESWYKPMLEVVDYLKANGFDIYIVTATERNIVRAIVGDKLGVDPAHVIGTEYGYTATGQGDQADGDYTFSQDDTMVFDGTYAGENAKTCKVDAIVREIGKQPVLAFGNSSGDTAMLNYALAKNSHPSASFMVLADDTEREYGNTEKAAENRASWEKLGFTMFSMRDDFKTIYGDGVKKTSLS
jgi:phosphoserine phosphatase